MRGLPDRYRPALYPGGAFLYLHLCCAGLMTAATVVVAVAEPSLMALFGLVLFGSSLAVAEAKRRRRLDDTTRARVEPFLRRAGLDDVDDHRWLLAVLTDIDGRTRRARRRGRVALDAVAGSPQLTQGLIRQCRDRRLDLSVFAGRLRQPGHSVLTPVLASLHADGHVREAAVTVMDGGIGPAHLPFLLQRAVDWVPEVRAAAHQVLRAGLEERPELLEPAREAYRRVARHKHAPALARLLDSPGPGPKSRPGLQDAGPGQRRADAA